jgi:CRISPR associated protein, Cas1 family
MRALRIVDPPGNGEGPVLQFELAFVAGQHDVGGFIEQGSGYDPTIGVMHEGSDGSSKFIFDLMEPERPSVDRAVMVFVKTTVFDPADFAIRRDGVCRLNPEMERMVGATVSK